MNSRKSVRLPCSLLIGIALPWASMIARADDPAATFLAKLFSIACMQNVGNDEKIRAWAQEQKLAEVTDPAAFKILVGEGEGGAAWMVPGSQGTFALAIRGKTHVCAVYAQSASPEEVERNFRVLMEGITHPGVEVKVAADNTRPGESGTVHTLEYRVSADGVPNRGNLYSMQTAERSGGVFQASMQAAQFISAP